MGYYFLEGAKYWVKILREKYLRNREQDYFLRSLELPYGSIFLEKSPQNKNYAKNGG